MRQSGCSGSSRDPVEGLRDAAAARALLELVRRRGQGVSLMEVCGTHTVAIRRGGLRAALPAGPRLISGPGCPVCVTPGREVEKAIRLACEPGVLLFCFPDMLRVPGACGSLETARATRGARVRTIYSPIEALEFAAGEPGRKAVIFGVGFETTIPIFASVLRRARERGIRNLFLLPAFKLLPPGLAALLSRPGIGVDGLILPGNVTAVIGADAYRFIAARHRLPGVVAGFETSDILRAVLMLLEMIADGEPRILNEYTRFSDDRGNAAALAAVREVFAPRDSVWRGLGTVPGSGLGLNEAYAAFDAGTLLDGEVPPVPDPPGCICGDVIVGAREPEECTLFGGRCTPSRPAGACMVSGEGACAAHYLYGGGAA